jgi:type VI secretion system protein ImpM
MPSPVGLFGKIPAQGDFFRHNVADPAVQALVAWLQDAIEPVYRSRLPLPRSVRFVFRAPQAASVLVGAMAASVDKVGREFPLCAFAAVPARDLAARFPAVPLAWRPFLDAAAELVAGAPGKDGAALAAQAAALRVPGPAEAESAEASLRRDAAAERSAEVAQRLFGDLPPGALAYAVGTFGAAVKPLRGREPAKASVALDCPAERDLDRWAWLEAARRALGWAAPPPFFWMDGALGHVVVSLGSPSAGLLAHLCDPSKPGSKVWPLRTAQAAAIETARKGLSPAAQRAIDAPDSTLEALVAAASA